MKKIALDRFNLVSLADTIDRESFVRAVQGLRDAIDPSFWTETMRTLLRNSGDLLLEFNRDFADLKAVVERDDAFAKHQIIPGPEQIELDLPLVYLSEDEYNRISADSEAVIQWRIRRLNWVFHTYLQFHGYFSQLVLNAIEKPLEVELDGLAPETKTRIEGCAPDFMFEIVKCWHACHRLVMEYLQEKAELLTACGYDMQSVDINLGYDAMGALATAERAVLTADRDAAFHLLNAFRWAVVEAFGLRDAVPRDVLRLRSTVGLCVAALGAEVQLADDPSVLGNVLVCLEQGVLCAEVMRISDLFPFYRVIHKAVLRLRTMEVGPEQRGRLVQILIGGQAQSEQ
ncbi:hypothetical protein LLH23_18155 [bacterium]|nr:hypothetical protein [bacterium]